VVLNAIAAREHGAQIQSRCKFVSAHRTDGVWISTLVDQHSQQQFTVKSKALINAAGPWVDEVDHQRLALTTQHHVELVKGSHIVFPKLYEGKHAYMLQNDDKRIIFVIPYQDHFTMIGTTDIPYHDDPATVQIAQEERDYLCKVVNRYFKQSISPADIVDEWSGVRPLQADESSNPSAVTRDYTLEIEDNEGSCPILSIFGGKITTYRELAEHALLKLKPYFPNMGQPWTANKPLPGGNITRPEKLLRELIHQYPFLSAQLLERYVYSYGSISEYILDEVDSLEAMGQDFGGSLYEIEIDYLCEHEWAQTVEDILWRRSKLGLLKDQIDHTALTTYLQQRSPTHIST
jgi:glycerol-3-phosphate dehydrogenase